MNDISDIINNISRPGEDKLKILRKLILQIFPEEKFSIEITKSKKIIINVSSSELASEIRLNLHNLQLEKNEIYEDIIIRVT